MTSAQIRIALQIAEYLVPDQPLVADRLVIAAMESLDETYKAYLRNRDGESHTKVLLGREDFLKVLVTAMYLDLSRRTALPPTRKALVHVFVALVAAYSLRRTILIAMVGAGRVLHRYGTPSVRDMYEFLTNRNLDETQVSRAKRLLIEMLIAKLHPFLTVTTGPRNEKGVKLMPNSSPFAHDVYDGLDLFAPHTGQHLTADAVEKTKREWRYCPQEFIAAPLPAEAHLNAFHNLFHTGCFTTMAAQFNGKALVPSVPDFTMTSGPEPPRQRKGVALEPRIEMLKQQVAGRAQRLESARPVSFEIRVDGELRARTTRPADGIVVRLEESDFLVRVVGIETGRETTIGTYLLTEQDLDGRRRRCSLISDNAAERIGVRVDIEIEFDPSGRGRLTVWIVANGAMAGGNTPEKDLMNIEEMEPVVAPGSVWSLVA